MEILFRVMSSVCFGLFFALFINKTMATKKYKMNKKEEIIILIAGLVLNLMSTLLAYLLIVSG